MNLRRVPGVLAALVVWTFVCAWAAGPPLIGMGIGAVLGSAVAYWGMGGRSPPQAPKVRSARNPYEGRRT